MEPQKILDAFPNVLKPRALKRLNPFLRMAESVLKQSRETGRYLEDAPSKPGAMTGYEYYGADPARLFALATSFNRYTLNHGRVPDFFEPKSVTEKLLVMKMFGAVPEGPPADKLINERYVPQEQLHLLQPFRRVWMENKPCLPDNDLVPPGRYFLKTNFGAGNNIPVTFPISEDQRATLLAKVNTWFERRHRHGLWAGEWWYQQISPRVYLEENLAEEGSDLADWKFWVTGGKLQVVQIDLDRSTNHVQQIYDRDFQLTNLELYYDTSKDSLPRPKRFDDLVAISEGIGSNLEFARVDFFLRDDEIFLGEITLCPFGAKRRIRSDDLDRSMGRNWSETRLFPN